MGRSRRRGGGSSARSGGLFGKKAAPAPKPAARSGGLYGSSRPSAPPPARAPPPPAASPAPPPAQQQGGGMLSGLGGMVAQGMAIGTGSAIAHQAVNGIVGSFSGGSKSEPEVQQQPQQGYAQQSYGQPPAGGACAFDQEELYKCLKEQNGDAAQCQYFFDSLKQCQENQRY